MEIQQKVALCRKHSFANDPFASWKRLHAVIIFSIMSMLVSCGCYSDQTSFSSFRDTLLKFSWFGDNCDMWFASLLPSPSRLYN